MSPPRRTIDFRFAPPTSWTAICRPDDRYKTLVRQDGALLYDLVADRATWCFSRVVEFGLRTDVAPIEIHQRTEDARTPILRTALRYPHATLNLTTFAHRHDGQRRTDVVLWEILLSETVPEALVQLLVTANERTRVFGGTSAAPSHEVYSVELADAPAVDWYTAMLAEVIHGQAAAFATGPLAFRSTPLPLAPVPALGFGPTPALATEGRLLRAGEVLRGALVFPLNHTEVAGLDLAWVESALGAERDFWAGFDLLRLPFDVPDPAVMAMLEASARNILQAREIVDGLPEFRVGSAVFRALWVVDGHFLLEAAQYLGYREDAAAGLDVLLRRAAGDGSIAQMPLHTKETAIALTTFVRQSELLGDDEILRRLWPRVLAGIAFIESLRRQAYELPPDSPAHGLLPPAFPDGGIGGLRAEYTSTLWTLAALQTVAGAAQRLGYLDDAARVQRLFDGLMADFRAHAARDQHQLPDGTPYLPMAKPGSGDHSWLADFAGEPPVWHTIRPQTGTWALAQAIYPGEVFAPDDPLVRSFLHLLDSVDDEQGIPTDTAFWTYRMIWTYSASFYAHAWLWAGHPDKAVDYLYAFANHAAPTRVWREEQPMVGTHAVQLSGDMPHNWASAEFVRLVRHLLVLERGERLELLPGLPEEWLGPGKRIHLARTPTRFGPITLRVEAEAADVLGIEVERQTDWPRPLEQVLLHVPASWQTATIVIDGAETARHDPSEAVVALPNRARTTIVLRRSAS